MHHAKPILSSKLTNTVCKIPRRILCLVCVVTILCGSDLVGLDTDFESSKRVSYMKLDAIPLPSVPQDLIRNGFSSGQTRIIVEVDHFGELRDYIVLESTHGELIEELDKVIYQWDFHPPIKNGKFATVVQEIIVNVTVRGSMVSLDSATAASHFMETLGKLSRANAYKIANWQELDSLPEPIYVIPPMLSNDLLPERKGSRVTFKFYIDQNGDVRIPHVSALNTSIDDRVLVTVQETLRQWRFTPCTVNGKPVSVSVAQEFDFYKN